jgi:hypothetical protein
MAEDKFKGIPDGSAEALQSRLSELIEVVRSIIREGQVIQGQAVENRERHLKALGALDEVQNTVKVLFPNEGPEMLKRAMDIGSVVGKDSSSDGLKK